jgi:hypothetical protein
VEKAEKDERRGQHRFCTDALGWWSEVNQPCLVRVELQPELPQPLAQHLVYAIGVVFARKKHDKVVAVADQGTDASQARVHLLGKPLVEHVMQKYVGKQG